MYLAKKKKNAKVVDWSKLSNSLVDDLCACVELCVCCVVVFNYLSCGENEVRFNLGVDFF